MTDNYRGDNYESSYGMITDEGLRSLKDRIGQPIPPQEFGPPIPVASEESVRLWSWGIGDDNPLYNSIPYGEQSPWGGMLGHPSIALAMDPHRLGVMGGLPGVHAMYAGVNWEWFAPIRLGTRVATKASLTDVQERSGSSLSSRAIKELAVTNIEAYDGSRLAKLEHVLTRHERRAARNQRSTRKQDGPSVPHEYTTDEVNEIVARYRAEPQNRRGSRPRSWEAVEVGEQLSPILKGPLTVTGIVAFAMAVRPVHLTRAHRMLFQLFDRHPGTAIPNSFNVPEPPISVHWSHEQAQFSGLRTAYDFGMERACWALHLITDWMGDAAFLKAARISFRGLNYLGDLTEFRGSVVDKYEIGGLGLVRCDITAVNQRDEVTTVGSALVVLPHATGADISERALAEFEGGISLLHQGAPALRDASTGRDEDAM